MIGTIESPTAVELISMDAHSAPSQSLFAFGLGAVICLALTHWVRRKVVNS